MLYVTPVSSRILLRRHTAPRTIVVGVSSLHEVALFEHMGDTMDALFDPDTPYTTLNLIPRLIEKEQECLGIEATALDPHPHESVSAFEDLFIRQRLPRVRPLDEYGVWKHCILQKIRLFCGYLGERGERGASTPRIVLLPYWTLYPAWLPATLTPTERESTILIAPLAIDPPPYAQMYYTDPHGWEEHTLPLL